MFIIIITCKRQFFHSPNLVFNQELLSSLDVFSIKLTGALLNRHALVLVIEGEAGWAGAALDTRVLTVGIAGYVVAGGIA